MLNDLTGINVVRDPCPAAGIPTGTGDITVFNPANSTQSDAIDVSASMTNLRATCTSTGNELVSNATFDVVAQRRSAGPARQVVLPYFDVVLRGGTTVVAKQLGQVVLTFPAGSLRASVRTRASARVSLAAATLPANVRQDLTRVRKVGDKDAAVDPLTDPAIREAVAAATFEHLVGFQMTAEQLRYNATR